MLTVDRFFSPVFSAEMISDLSDLTQRLAAGEKILVRGLDNAVVSEVKFPKAKLGKLKPEVLVHGMRARDIEQVMSYLSGDAHDRSKIQWFNGVKFYNFS